MTRTKNRLVVLAAVFLGPPICYGLAALIFAAIAAGRAGEAGSSDIVVYVRGDAVHAEFVFPVRNRLMDWSRLMPASDFRSPPADASHISFGWGQRDFYLRTPRWSDFDLGVGLRALSYGEETVLHVYRLSSASGYSWSRRLKVSDGQYRTLVDYVLSSSRMVDGMPMALKGMAYGASDVFYEAKGTYSPFMTCNEWVNRGLRSAELNAALWSPFSFGVKWALPE